ncbi:MAG: hypothetical protein RL526_318 [Actinomycetota bacterium]
MPSVLYRQAAHPRHRWTRSQIRRAFQEATEQEVAFLVKTVAPAFAGVRSFLFMWLELVSDLI